MNDPSGDLADHPGLDRILASVDDELPEREWRSVSDHLERCATCAARREELLEASSLLSRELRALDVPAPDSEPPGLPTGETAAATGSRAEGAGGRARPSGERRRRFLIAAMLLLAFTGIGLAAAPGSPVRGLLAEAGERVSGLFSPAETEDTAAPTSEAASTGVTVGSREGRIVIQLTEPRPGAVVRVRLVPGERATVRAPGARYRAAPGSVEVVGARTNVIRIELPVQPASARVMVNGRTVLVREDGDLRFLAPSVDSAGSEFSFPVGRGDEP